MNIPLNIDVQQILLHLFNFGILAIGLYVLLYKPVKSFMDKRTAYFADLEKQTQENLANAQALQADYKKKLDGADEEIAERKAQANKNMEEKREKELDLAKEQAALILSDARKEAAAEKDRIVQSAQKEIADMVSEATEKLVLASVSDAYDQFLDSAEGSVADEES